MFANLLRYRSYRYLWWFLATVAVGWALYASQGGFEPANGGTWQGYVLGTVAALLIVWLALLGLRKRSYRSSLGTTQGWTSAHVYLGTAVWFLATLHCAAQFGWNVHTLAYALMTVVIVSGMAGLYAYLAFPSRLAGNRAGQNRRELFGELYALNQQGLALARRCSADIQTAIASAFQRTTVGGGVIAQLTGRDRSTLETLDGGPQSNVDQARVIDLVSGHITRADRRTEVTQLQELLAVVCRRQAVLRRLREDIRLQAWLKVWLYVHVPLTAATLAALVAHILSTFIYW